MSKKPNMTPTRIKVLEAVEAGQVRLYHRWGGGTYWTDRRTYGDLRAATCEWLRDNGYIKAARPTWTGAPRVASLTDLGREALAEARRDA